MSWLTIVNKADRKVEIVIDGIIGGSFFFDEGTTMESVNAELKEVKAVDADEINIRILNSPGGSVLHGMGIVDILNEMKAKKTVEIVGMAASMAAGIAMVAKKEDRTMSPNSWFLVHRVQGGAHGTIEEIKSQLTFIEKNEKQVVSLMLAGADISEDDLNALMDENGGKGEFLTAEEAVEKGFIGEVKDPESKVKIAAYAKDFGHLPTLPTALKVSSVEKPGIDVDAIVERVINGVKSFFTPNDKGVVDQDKIKGGIKTEIENLKKDFDSKVEAFENAYKKVEETLTGEVTRLKGELVKAASQSTKKPKNDPNLPGSKQNEFSELFMETLTPRQKKMLDTNAKAMAVAKVKTKE